MEDQIVLSPRFQTKKMVELHKYCCILYTKFKQKMATFFNSPLQPGMLVVCENDP